MYESGSKCRRAGPNRFEVEPGLEVTVLSGRETDRPPSLFCWTLGPASARLCEGLPHILIIIAHGTVDPLGRSRHLELKEDLIAFQNQCVKPDTFSRIWPLGPT